MNVQNILRSHITALQLASSVEVLKSNLDTLAHGLLTLANPHAGVEELLVGLVLAIRVANSRHKVVFLVEDVVTDTGEVGVLHVSVEVDLDDTVADSLLVLLLGRAGAAVEDEEDGLVLLGASLLLNVGLVLAEEFRVEADVAGLVDTVHITETSGNGEVRADLGEGVVDGEDVLRLGVEGVVINALVVDTVLLTTGDTNFLLTVSGGFSLGRDRRRFLPSRATASWEQHASGTWRWCRCCSRQAPQTDQSCGKRRGARRAA